MNTNDLLGLFLIKCYTQSCTLPFREDGFLWAANDHMAVRIPDTQECTLELNDNAIFPPLVKTLINGVNPNNCTISLHFPLAEKPCEECQGAGYTEKLEQFQCPDCDGYGEFEHGNHTYYCKNCDETGWIDGEKFTQDPCDNCNCSGIMPCDHRIAGALFRGRYIRALKMLPGLKMWINPNPNEASTFAFDGGCGVIMPMRV